MNHTQGLCDSHPGLVLRQSIQPVQHVLNLAVSTQQLLCKLLCDKLSHGERLHDDALTESSLFDLLCCKGKH
jgi:hypothetical protein